MSSSSEGSRDKRSTSIEDEVRHGAVEKAYICIALELLPLKVLKVEGDDLRR